jgi:hypothetical protein
MDEEVKVNFSRPMMVLKIRDTYKAPYHKNKYITIKKNNTESLVDLKRHIQQFTGNWSSGTYDIQFVQKEGTYMQMAIYATFCRIEVRNGRVSKLLKNSPYTKKIYPCWQYFTKKKKKVVKKPVKKTKKVKKVVKKAAKKVKKVVKKKPVKKTTKKKTVKKKK